MNVKTKIKNYAVCKQFFSNGNYFLPFITANISFPLSSFHIKILIILYSFCDTHTHPSHVFSPCPKQICTTQFP